MQEFYFYSSLCLALYVLQSRFLTSIFKKKKKSTIGIIVELKSWNTEIYFTHTWVSVIGIYEKSKGAIQSPDSWPDFKYYHIAKWK